MTPTHQQFYDVARKWMQKARRMKRYPGAERYVQALVRSARGYVRVGRTWQYVLSRAEGE